MQQQPTTAHRRSHLFSGFIISQLAGFFTGGFFYDWFAHVDALSEDIALVFIGTIFMITMMSAIASYFWAGAGLTMRTSRGLAVVNAFPVWIVYAINPSFNGDIFLMVFAGIMIAFCAPLGSWFGRRFFYE